MAHKGKLKTRSEKEKKERKQNITTDINTVNITQNRGANHLSNKMQLQNKQTFSLIVSWKFVSLPRTENNSCHMHLFLHSVQLISSSFFFFFFFWGGGGGRRCRLSTIQSAVQNQHNVSTQSGYRQQTLSPQMYSMTEYICFDKSNICTFHLEWVSVGWGWADHKVSCKRKMGRGHFSF